MVPGLKPVMLLVKMPVPVLSVVLLLKIVGLADVLQQTPLAVTCAPPLLVTFPPLEAVVVVMEDTPWEVTVGACVVLTVALNGPEPTALNAAT